MGVLSACLGQVIPNPSEVASSSKDSEHVHQLRVGIRRSRVALREFSPLLHDIKPGWETHLI